jgi:hypothetical protein
MRKLLFILVFVLSSCGFKSLIIRNLDYYVASKISSKLALYSKQEKSLDIDVQTMLNNQKTRAKELIKVIDSINIDQPIQAQIQLFRKYYFLIATDVSLIVSKHLATLDKKQITEFLNNIRKENNEIEEQIAEFTLSKSFQFISRFIGSLTDSQRQLVESYKDHLKLRQVERHRRRIAAYAKMAEIFQSKENWHTQFNKLFTSMNDPKQAQVITKNNAKIFELVEKLRQTLTPKQKKFFSEKKTEIKEMIDYFIKYKYD